MSSEETLSELSSTSASKRRFSADQGAAEAGDKKIVVDTSSIVGKEQPHKIETPIEHNKLEQQVEANEDEPSNMSTSFGTLAKANGKESTAGAAPTTIFGSAATTTTTFTSLSKTNAKADFSALFKKDSTDDRKKPMLPEAPIEITTGEEHEETLVSYHAKLFDLHEKDWKERGTGLVKLNVSKDDSSISRLVMRADGIHKAILNVRLFKDMKIELVQERHLRFLAVESREIKTYLIKMKNKEEAGGLLDQINVQISKI